MSIRRTGLNTLAYLGVESPTPPNFISINRDPTTTDYQGFNLGTFWLNTTSQDLFFLSNKDNQVATWSNFSGGSGAIDFTTDSGTATVSADNINMLGGSNINTAGSGDTVTVALDNTVTITGTFTANGDIITDGGDFQNTAFGVGVVQSNGSGVLSSSTGANGQVLIGGGAAPAWANVTSTDTSVTITNGANSINLAVNVGAAGGISNIIPDSGTSPVVPNGSGEVTFTGGTLITTVGGTNEVTFNLDNGTDGQLIIASTAGSPAYAALASADASVTITNGSNSIDLSVNSASVSIGITEIDDTDSTYTVLSTDQMISCDVSSGVITINLPNSTTTGRRIWIKDNSGNAATNNITLTTPGGTVTIDGVTSYAMNTDYQSVTAVFDGTNYLLI